MKNPTFTSWVCLCLMAAVFAPSLRSENAQDRGKRILSESVEALGGPKFLALDNVVLMGRAYSFYREELSGLSIARIVVHYRNDVKDPARNLAILERQDFGKKLDYGVLFQNDEAYEITFRGARPISEERFTRFKNAALTDIFYILRERLHEPGLIIESRGTEVWDNSPVEIVDITDADNQVVTVYFHASTKLPIRELVTRRDPKTKEKDDEETIYNKYRESDGVQWPLTVQRIRNGEKVYQMFADSMEINKKMPAPFFEIPSGMKKLKPEN